MKEFDAKAQHAYISSMRKLANPLPVKMHKMPKWLPARLKKACPDGDDAYHRLNKIAPNSYLWLDHWGTVKTELYEFLVSEPYGFDASSMEGLQRFCAALNLLWTIESNSWHYPGHTVRIVIYPEGNWPKYQIYERTDQL